MKIIIQIFIASILVVFTSCTSVHKVNIVGQPQTKIYTPKGTHIATVPESGKVQVKLDANAYYAYLLSMAPNSENYVPFALDYKNCSYAGTQAEIFLGATLDVIGLAVAIPATVMTFTDSEDTFAGVLWGIGGGSILLGTALGMPADSRMHQTSYDYKFKYLKSQRTNSDISITKPNIEYVQYDPSMLNKGSYSKQEEIQYTVEESTSSRRSLGQQTNRSFKNYGKTIAGEYVGKGNLSLGNSIIERYDNIKVIITRVDDDTVSVQVVEGGSDFFNSPIEYKVNKNADGTYSLNCVSIPSAIIEIDNDNLMMYVHPRVNIDGTIYTLNIKAKMK